MSNRKKNRICSKKYCTANKNGFCVALTDTNFKRECPFFRDKRTMSEQELIQYEKYAMHVG